MVINVACAVATTPHLGNPTSLPCVDTEGDSTVRLGGDSMGGAIDGAIGGRGSGKVFNMAYI